MRAPFSWEKIDWCEWKSCEATFEIIFVCLNFNLTFKAVL